MSVWIQEKQSKKHGLRYYVRWRHKGARGCKTAGGSLDNAKAIRNEIEGKFLRGENLVAAATNSTFGYLCEQFFKAQACNEESTQRMCRYLLEPFLALWKNKSISSLTKNDLKSAMTDLTPLHEFNGNQMRLIKLRQVLKSGIGDSLTREKFEELLDDSALERKDPKNAYRFLEDYEINTLLACAYDYSPIAHDIIKFLLGTLMRVGEVLGPQNRKHPNFGHGITREMVNNKMVVYIKETKTGEPRAIPINAEIQYIINRVKTGPLFDYSRSAFETGFNRIWKKTKLPGRCRVHDMRHTGISILIGKGWYDREIMQMSGHKTASAFQVYAHLRTDAIVERMRNTSFGFPTMSPALEVIGG